ncbi:MULTISPECIES: hypothetical protein [Aeromonas]|uniref:hypothetical protein n=1 Tax=Aeromonas TaxID=642 RepID=UPI000FEBB64E|nr:hypothetical protein [Aeromonas caviae]RWT81308.1 hypothetical protein DN604_00635 [Aeromonas caviae]WVM47960.1 hypothetical protein V0242_25495 [Aeromonas hydrophila]
MAKYKERTDFTEQEWKEFVECGGTTPEQICRARLFDCWVYVRFFGLVPVAAEQQAGLLEHLIRQSRAGIPHCIKRPGQSSIECKADFMMAPEAAELVALGYGVVLQK